VKLGGFNAPTQDVSGACGSARNETITAWAQTIHQCCVDVACGLALLFGIGTNALLWGFWLSSPLWQPSFFAETK